MNNPIKVVLSIAILLFVLSMFYFNIDSTEDIVPENNVESEQAITPPQEKPKQVRYFKESDNVIISASDKILYTDNPSTQLTYYALDSNNQPVHFREGDRAFVRILGIIDLYTQNTEIYHPKNPDGSVDNTIFAGKINVTAPGKYLIKVCLGKSINLEPDGDMVWPFGCYESINSDVFDVYVKED